MVTSEAQAYNMTWLQDLWTCILYSLALVAALVLHAYYEPRDKQTAKERAPKTRFRKSSSDYQLFNIMVKLGLAYDASLHFESFCDHYKSFEEVSLACRKAGLDKCNLIIGIDFTASNEWQGRKSFHGNSLHKINGGKILNPYQKVIWIIGKTLAPFDEDNKIPCYGFGDVVTADEAVFPFKDDGSPCEGIQDVMNCYTSVVKKVTLSGPTSFAPVINAAIDVVKIEKKYHILVIVADGQVTEEDVTIDAIVEASNYPISIIVIGVGDGPWDIMEEFDKRLPRRKFDNFRFVNYHKVTACARFPDSNFALQALMEIPHQYKSMKYLGYLPNVKEKIPEYTNEQVPENVTKCEQKRFSLPSPPKVTQL